MAPVRTLRVVRSRPAAFSPTSTDSATRKAVNLAMPMRMVGGSASTLSTCARASATTTSPQHEQLTVTTSLATDHTRCASCEGDAHAVEHADHGVAQPSRFSDRTPQDQADGRAPALDARTGRATRAPRTRSRGSAAAARSVAMHVHEARGHAGGVQPAHPPSRGSAR